MADQVFVTISEGDEAVDAHQLLVIDDPGVARDVARLIAKRLGVAVPVARGVAESPAVVPLPPTSRARGRTGDRLDPVGGWGGPGPTSGPPRERNRYPMSQIPEATLESATRFPAGSESNLRETVAAVLDDVEERQGGAVVAAVVVEVLLLDGTASRRPARWIVQLASVGALTVPRAVLLGDAGVALRALAVREADA